MGNPAERSGTSPPTESLGPPSHQTPAWASRLLPFRPLTCPAWEAEKPKKKKKKKNGTNSICLPTCCRFLWIFFSWILPDSGIRRVCAYIVVSLLPFERLQALHHGVAHTPLPPRSPIPQCLVQHSQSWMGAQTHGSFVDHFSRRCGQVLRVRVLRMGSEGILEGDF